MPLSPAAAAKIAGVSRSLISREIKAGSLKATLKNNGHQSVIEADLEDWMGRRTERAQMVPVDPIEPPKAPPDIERVERLERDLATTREVVARLEGQAEATAARLVDLMADRDAWRDQAREMATRPGLFARLFGR